MVEIPKNGYKNKIKKDLVTFSVADPNTLCTDLGPAFSNLFGSGSGFSVLIFAVHFFVFIITIFWVF